MTRLRGYERTIELALLDVLKRGTTHDLGVYEKFAVDLPGDVRRDLGPLEALFTYLNTRSDWAGATRLTDEQKNAMDGWLAPRLHAALRLPRDVATDMRLWTWLALTYGATYMAMRWPVRADEKSSTWRYTGEALRNGLARLWWGAEMVRDGDDYRYVAPLFRRTRTAQFALELSYSNYRPAAIAFVRFVENVPARKSRKVLNDDDMKNLSKRINAKLSLTSLEGIASFELDDEPGLEWYRTVPDVATLTGEALPTGPASAKVGEATLVELERWFGQLK